MSKDLSKYASLVFVRICCFLLLFCTVPVGDKWSVTGSSTISSQLLAGSIMMRHIKSISDPSLPLSVYGPIRLTHRHSQGVSTTSFGGNFPHFCFLFVCWLDKIYRFCHSIGHLFVNFSNTSQTPTCLPSKYDLRAVDSGDTMQLCGVKVFLV